MLIISQVPISLYIGSTSVISNLIGEKDSKLGKMVAMVTYLEGLIFAIALSVITYSFSTELAEQYAMNRDVIEKLDGSFQTLSL